MLNAIYEEDFLGFSYGFLAAAPALEPTDPRYFEKRAFLEAGFLACDAAITWARRYADAAAQLAQQEKDPKKKAKWEQIAAVNRWVPENPARSFAEALQCQWWVQAWTRIEFNIGGNVGNGRMDQYLYPYYRADKAAGRITDDEVVDLLRMLYLKMYTNTFSSRWPATPRVELRGFPTSSAFASAGRRRMAGTQPTNSLISSSNPNAASG